jgi:uncharacterized protein (TIGR02118 family)
MPTLVVSYPVGDGTQFDAQYYVETHIPLVDKCWTPYGLSSCEILLPEGDQPWHGGVLLRFESSAAIDAALNGIETPKVLGDLPNFTNIAPVIYRAV